MKRTRSRAAIGTILAILDAGLLAYDAGLIFRDPVPPPAHYEQVSQSQLGSYDRRNVEIKGRPVSAKYEPRILGKYLEIIIELEDGKYLTAQSGLVPASLANVRTANTVSGERAKEIAEILKMEIATGIDSITLNGRPMLEDGVFRVYSVGIKGKKYPLLSHLPNQSAI